MHSVKLLVKAFHIFSIEHNIATWCNIVSSKALESRWLSCTINTKQGKAFASANSKRNSFDCNSTLATLLVLIVRVLWIWVTVLWSTCFKILLRLVKSWIGVLLIVLFDKVSNKNQVIGLPSQNASLTILIIHQFVCNAVFFVLDIWVLIMLFSGIDPLSSWSAITATTQEKYKYKSVYNCEAKTPSDVLCCAIWSIPRWISDLRWVVGLPEMGWVSHQNSCLASHIIPSWSERTGDKEVICKLLGNWHRNVD